MNWTDNIWLIAALWMGMALIASLISIRIGISVALIEILSWQAISLEFIKLRNGLIFSQCWVAAF